MPFTKVEPAKHSEENVQDETDNVDKKTWSEFTQNTTFHGVKYIFEDTSQKLRRVLWMTMVTTAIIFFVVQVSVRTEVYFRYETITNVDLTFVDSLDFPAVTVCNQNAYHLRRTVQEGFYMFIDQLYNMDNWQNIQYPLESDQTSMEDFVNKTSHRIEDIIDRCAWMGHPCDMERDFQATWTDLGICFTFNGKLHDRKNVSKANVGLQLILNAEQYEHMRGPQNDAGFKILLHEADDIPLVNERGFVVAPGTHTLASLSMTKKVAMIPPWGKCSPTAPPLSVCKTMASAKSMMSLCECIAPYMNHSSLENSPVCTMTQSFQCLSMQHESIRTVASPDNCTIPCNRTEFHPSLSYAQLSKINIDRVVLRDPNKRRKCKEDHLAATETYQRVQPSIVERDQKILGEGILIYKSLTAGLNESAASLSWHVRHVNDTIRWMQNSSHVINQIKTEMEMISNMNSSIFMGLIRDCLMKSMDNVFKVDTSEFLHCFRVLSDGDIALPFVAPFVVNDSAIIRECRSKQPFRVKPQRPPGPPRPAESCHDLLMKNAAKVKPFYRELQPAIEFLTSLNGSYISLMERTINSVAGYDTKTFAKHNICIDRLLSLTETIIPSMLHLQAAIELVMFGSTLADVESGWLEVIPYQSKLEEYMLYMDNLGQECWWIKKSIESSEEQATYDNAAVLSGSLMAIVQQTLFLEQNLQKSLDDVVKTIVQFVQEPIEAAKSYLAETKTKLSMHRTFSTPGLKSAIGRIEEQRSSLESSWEAIKLSMVQLASTLEQQFSSLFQLQIPVMSAKNIVKFEFLSRNNDTDHAVINTFWEQLPDATHEEVKSIILYIVKEIYSDPVDNMTMEVLRLLNDLANSITSIVKDAEPYIATSKMHTDFYLSNFMQVDIFYKELSFDVIEQKEAFGLLSLLGEVGGFMGLLLGASILTLCELIDYIAMFCMMRFHARKKPTPMPAWQRP